MIKKPSSVWVSQNMIKEKIDANYMHYKFINLLDCKLEGTKKDFQSMENGLLIDTLTDYTANGSFESLDNNVKYTDSKGIPFIRIKNMSEDGLVLDDLYYIDNDSYRFLKKSKLEGNELLFSKTGAKLGLAMVFPSNFGKASLADNIFKVVYKSEYDVHYIASFLNSKYGKLWVERLSQGSAQPTIIKESFRQIKIPIPSPEIQKYIGDKVRRAEELREEAKRLKEETEDLIINKLGTINLEENRNYSSAFISSGKIVERIDSEYYHLKYLKIEDELNRKGYKVKKLGEVCTRIFNGRTYSTTDKERKYCNVGVGELGDWFVNKSKEKFINEKVDKKYCLKANSIIWGNAAHLAKYIGEKVNIVLEEETVIPTTEVTAIEPNEEAIDPYYLFIFMRTQWGYYQIQRTVKGMTAHSYPQDISNILVPIIDLTNEELEVLKNNVITSYKNELNAKQLIQQAKQDVEDLIEGNFDMSKLDNNYTAESRC